MEFPVLLPALKGFGLGASLIIAIGAQNAFVLRQGLRGERVFVVAAVCFLCDAVLILLGAAGFGTAVAAVPWLTDAVAWAGAAFLLVYGVRALRSALRPGALVVENGNGSASARLSVGRAVGLTLAISLLNPHVYLDTVVLLGSVAGQYGGTKRALFAAGATAASLVWFFGLGYGARWLAPLFRRPAAWRVLDLLIAFVMAAIAWSLVGPMLLDRGA
jgi:L-lysine exporter family protein LysE/ArgO